MMDYSSESGSRARFAALRCKTFSEMRTASARWRAAWIVPFNLGVLGILLTRGEFGVRGWILSVAVGILCIHFGLQGYLRRAPHPAFDVAVGPLCFFVTIAVTGGLASPLLPLAGGLLWGVSIGLSESPRAKRIFFGSFIAIILVLAFLSHTAVGELAGPLMPNGAWPSREFVLISAATMIFLAVNVSRMGWHIANAYERVGIELAERREELCSEGEDRTRVLEGIAARLAHEVKNPLAAIKGLSTHMSRQAEDPKTAERLSIVAAEADRLQAIVDGFLSFSRGLDDLKIAQTKPHQIARELVLLLETRAAESQVELVVTGDESISVNADGRKIRQALLNIVLNALQATPAEGKVVIHIARANGPLEDNAPKRMERIQIRVRDNGPGMTPEVLDRIRKPYFTTKESGTGLGVAVARGIVEQHGGQLLFESAPGRGTTATLEIPICAKLAGSAQSLPNPCRKVAELFSRAPVEEKPAEPPMQPAPITAMDSE